MSEYDYEIIDRRSASRTPTRLDFERMKSEYLKARERVECSVVQGDPVAVADAVIAAVMLWDGVGPGRTIGATRSGPSMMSFPQAGRFSLMMWHTVASRFEGERNDLT